MGFFSYLERSDVFLVSAATAIIIFAIVVTAAVQDPSEGLVSKVITVGPVWKTNTWLCTSTEDFMVHAVLIAYNEPNQLEIFVSGSGSQPNLEFVPRELNSFSIGGPADSSIRITRSQGTITGFITMETADDAKASCEQI